MKRKRPETKAEQGHLEGSSGRSSEKAKKTDGDTGNAKGNALLTESTAQKSSHKRPYIPGKVQKLTVASHPKSKLSRIHGSRSAGVTLSGAKVNEDLGTGGFLAPKAGKDTEEEVCITRKTSFSYSLKRCVEAFVKRG